MHRAVHPPTVSAAPPGVGAADGPELGVLRRIMATSPGAVVATSDAGRVVALNARACVLLGRSADELAGLPLGDVVQADGSGELWATRGDGTRLCVELRGGPVELDGAPLELTAIIDVTELRRSASLLTRRARQQEVTARLGELALEGARVEELVDLALGAIVTHLDASLSMLLELDAERRELRVAGSHGLTTGRDVGARVPVDGTAAGAALASRGPVVVVDHLASEDLPRSRELAHREVRSGVVLALGDPCRPWGVLGVYDRHPRDFTAEEVTFLRAVSNVLGDAIERRRVEERLRHEATHDRLTGLLDREAFAGEVDRRLAGLPAGGSVIAVDLDRFRAYNDRHGHRAGDELLWEVAARLEAAVGGHGLAARVGSDEFLLFTPGATIDTAFGVVGRARQELAAPYRIEVPPQELTATFGIAPAREGVAAEELIVRADVAMARAKRTGGAGVALVYDDAVAAARDRRAELDVALRDAVAARGTSVVYQPIVRLAEPSRPVALEALSRWSHGGREVPPAEFIAIAEELSLVGRLGEHVLHVALHDLAALGAGSDTAVAVNLSAVQLGDPGLVAMVEDALATAGVAPGRLELEITETVLVEAAAPVHARLDGLRALGVRLVLDDFGVGYSSLSYLQRLPVSKLKIDRSFITDIATSPSSRAIVGAIIDLGARMDLDVVAEGIEDALQAAVLSAMGCDLGQGWHFGRPVAAAVPACAART